MSWLNNLSYVWHIRAPIHHIFLSCHCFSPQVHVECPILRSSEGVWITHEAESHLLSSSCHLCLRLCFSPLRFDRLTPKPCFIPAPQTMDDTSGRKTCSEWHVTADEQKEPVYTWYLILKRTGGSVEIKISRWDSHKSKKDIANVKIIQQA